MERIIRRPENAERPAVSSLWQTVFGDEPGFIIPFFEAADPSKFALCSFEGDRLAGMLFLLPGVLCLSGEALEARYLYAAATHPSCRNRGVFRELEAEAARVARAEGAHCIVLVPAEAGLFAMYQKLGYRTRFWQSEAIAPAMFTPQTTVAPCGEENFLALRRDMLRRKGSYFDFYPSLCELRFRDFIRGNGEILFIRTSAGSGYTAGCREGEEYRIAETSLSGLALSHAAGALRLATGTRRVRVTGTVGVRRPVGMIKPLDGTMEPLELLRANPYLNLMLQ